MPEKDSGYPVVIGDIETELKVYMRGEFRKDSPFRLAILNSQIGSLSSHLTHDAGENPDARPYGTVEGEKADFGHAILQLLLYGISRGLPVQGSINSALVSIRERDWKSRQQTFEDICRGVMAYDGIVEGRAFIDPFGKNLDKMPEGSILVVAHADASISQYIKKCAGVVADHGGMACHVAIISREFKVPCLVGVGKATYIFENGDFLHLRGKEGKGSVIRVPEV